MTRTSVRLLYSGAVVALALAGLAGCAMPLAPGYEIQKESLEVRYAGGSPARLRVRATYQLRNVGTTELTSIETTLPDEKVFGRGNLRVLLDNRAVTLQAVAKEDVDEPGQMWRIPFDPRWPRKAKRSLLIEYDFAPAPPGVATIAVNGGSFHLRPFGWFPVLQTLEKLFAHDVVRPNPTPLSIVVPQGYLAIATGELVRARVQGGEAEYQFLLHKFDLDPFVVSGRYNQQEVKAKDGSIIFWTFAPLSPGEAQAAGARLAGAWKAYETAFGPIAKQQVVRPLVVETLAQIPARFAEEGGPAGRAFLGGALLNEPAFALGVTSDAFLSLAERELAQSWIGEQVVLQPQAELVMGLGFAEYASIVAAEARGGEPARRSAVEARLRAYDDVRARAVEKPIISITRQDPWELRQIAYTKGALFFVALEDRCGETALRQAIRHVVRALRGETGGFNELRSAIEEQTGQNLAEFFRTWLNQKGIPDDFRTRYEAKSGNQKTGLGELRNN